MNPDDLTWNDLLNQAQPTSDATATGIQGGGASVMDPDAAQFGAGLPPDAQQKLLAMRDQLPAEAGATPPTTPPAGSDTTALTVPEEATQTMTPEELIAAKAAAKKAGPGIWESLLAKIKGGAPVAAEDVAEGGLALSPLGIAAGVATPTSTANAAQDEDQTQNYQALKDLGGRTQMVPKGPLIPPTQPASGGGTPPPMQSVNPMSLFGDVSAQLKQQQRQGNVGAGTPAMQQTAAPTVTAPMSMPAPGNAPLTGNTPAAAQVAQQGGPSMMDLLRQAQNQAQNTGASNAIIKAGVMAGQALAQGHATVPIRADTSAIDELTKQAQGQPGDIMQQAALKSALQNQQLAGQKITQGAAATDPNSQQSKLYTSVAKQFAQNLGIDDKMFDGLSAAGTQQMLPLLERYQQHVEQNATNAQRASDRQAMQQMSQDQKTATGQDRTLQQTKQILESARGNPAVAQAGKDIYAAQKANSLANLYGDPNNLSPQMANLLAQEVGKIASGGVSNMATLEGLDIKTVPSAVASVMQKFTNEPTPANAGAFIKQYQDYGNALSKDAQKVIEDKYGRVIESSKAQLGPANYQALKDQYMAPMQSVTQADNATKAHNAQVAAIKAANPQFNDQQIEQIVSARMKQAQAAQVQGQQ